MSFYKIAGALLLVFCSTLLARYINSRLNKGLDELRAFLSLLQYIKTEIECFSLPIEEIFLRCDRSLLLRCGYCVDTAPKSLSALISECDIKDAEAKKILLDLSSEFGRSYREEQVKRCEHYISLLDRRRQTLDIEIPKKKKLNSTLFISGGLALAILLL